MVPAQDPRSESNTTARQTTGESTATAHTASAPLPPGSGASLTASGSPQPPVKLSKPILSTCPLVIAGDTPLNDTLQVRARSLVVIAEGNRCQGAVEGAEFFRDLIGELAQSPVPVAG